MTELPSALWHDLRKARKIHRCVECGGTIFINEFYHRTRGIWDYHPHSYKECEDCYKLKEEIDSHIKELDERVYFGGLYEYVFEGGDKNHIKKYLDIKTKRNAIIQDWMKERL